MSFMDEDLSVDPDDVDLCEVNETELLGAQIKGSANAAAAAAPAAAAPKQAAIKASQPSAVYMSATSKQARTPNVAVKTQRAQVVAFEPSQANKESLLYGTASATKIIVPVATAARADFASASGVKMTFSREALAQVFRVHGRDNESRGQRMGDISSTTVSTVTLVSSFNGDQLPMAVFLEGVEGKRYLLPANDGSPLAGRKALCILHPGSHTFAVPVVLVQRVKQNLLKMSQILGSFDIDKLGDAVSTIKNEEDLVLLANDSYLSNFIQMMRDKWNIPWNTFEFDRSRRNRYVPAILVNSMIAFIKEMHCAVCEDKHDLGSLNFTVQTIATGGAITSQMLSPKEEVTVSMELGLEYTFLEPHKLVTVVRV